MWPTFLLSCLSVLLLREGWTNGECQQLLVEFKGAFKNRVRHANGGFSNYTVKGRGEAGESCRDVVSVHAPGRVSF